MEVIPEQPFTILVRSFTDAPHRLPKHMTIAWAESSPDHYLPLLEAVCTKVPGNATIVQKDELRLSKH